MRGRDCPMCAEGRPDVSHDGARVFASDVVDAYLRRENVAPGYTIVVWRGRHVAEPTELSADEAARYWLDVLRVARALSECFEPAKLNFMTLGNAVPHLHTHVVPRYVDDPDPGRPLRHWDRDEPRRIPDDEYATQVAAVRAAIAGT
jgi:diadenosine tetraphosphate (Ap4A) HIT family hydrolase